MVEVLACIVMVGSVLTVFVLVWKQQQLNQESIGPRHIQFVSVCLIVPTILILGLEQVLSRETTATLIGGLTGYLLSGLGKYDPRQQDLKLARRRPTEEELAALHKEKLDEIIRQVVDEKYPGPGVQIIGRRESGGESESE
jgi:hypothetical protein